MHSTTRWNRQGELQRTTVPVPMCTVVHVAQLQLLTWGQGRIRSKQGSISIYLCLTSLLGYLQLSPGLVHVHLLLFINAKYAFIFVYRRSITRRRVHLRRGAFICENKLSTFTCIILRNEFNNGAIVCMAAWMSVMCVKIVVQGCYCMPHHV